MNRLGKYGWVWEGTGIAIKLRKKTNYSRPVSNA